MEQRKQKRYYKQGEIVWIKSENTVGEIKELNVKPDEKIYEVVVVITEGEQKGSTLKLNLWEIDKNKRKHKESSPKALRLVQDNATTILFAKVRDTAIIPSKIDENGGYDVYADIKNPVVNPKGQTIKDPVTIRPQEIVLIPTGIASSLLDKFRFVIKERGSTGSNAMAVRAGVIDSGYRGEWFVALNNTGKKPIIITDDVNKIIETVDGIYYPASKAIAQANLEVVPKAKVKEISYEELKAIPSSRGEGKIGSSGK